MTVKAIPLTLANGQQIVPVFGAGMNGGALQVIIAASVAPAAGTIQVEQRLAGSSQWMLVPHATGDLSEVPLSFTAYGNIDAYRFTIAGLSGGAGLVMWLADVEGIGFPDGAFTGLRALTVQPYTEANVKNGLQFFVRATWPLGDTIEATTGVRKIWFKTGAKPVIVKLRDFQYVAEEMRIRLFSGPTGVSGGTPLVVNNYNSVNPIASTVQVVKNVTTVSNGTEFAGTDAEYFFGESAMGNRSSASIPQGRERILPANTEFLVEIANTGSGSARAQYYLDWYEGDPDLPLNP